MFCALSANTYSSALVQQIAFDKHEFWVLASAAQKGKTSGGEIIVTNNFMSQREQSIRQITADEPGATGYKTSQIKLRCAFMSVGKDSL